MKRILFAMIALLFLSSMAHAQVQNPNVGRWWWGEVLTYIDSLTAHRLTVFQVDSVSDQTIAKFALEEDIEIERVSFFAQDSVTGDTTGLYFYEGTLLVDSLIIPTDATYLEFPANFTLTKDSSFVEIKLNDAQWGGTAGGAPNAVFVLQSRVKRQR